MYRRSYRFVIVLFFGVDFHLDFSFSSARLDSDGKIASRWRDSRFGRGGIADPGRAYTVRDTVI